MASNRIGRINDEIQKELASLLRTVKDPRVSETMLTITHVDTTSDLRYARVYVSALNCPDEKGLMKGYQYCINCNQRFLAAADGGNCCACHVPYFRSVRKRLCVELENLSGAPVFPHGNLAFFVAIFSEMTRLSAGVGLRLHSIHPSITRESKWRYIMKKINLRELYPDVYTTDFFVDVTEEVYKIEYYTIANQKQARYNIDKKTKATATVQKIDFGCSHKEQIENRYPQWLKTLVCSAWRKLFE